MSEAIQAAIEELEGRGRRITGAIAALRCLDAEPERALAVLETKVDSPPVVRKVAKPVKRKTKAVAPVRTADDRNPPGALQSAVLAAIKSRPMSSRETFEKLSSQGVRTTQDSIYQTCAALKVKGEIESRLDSDNVRRYYVVSNKEAAA